MKQLLGKKIKPAFLTKYLTSVGDFLTAKVSPNSWAQSGGKGTLAQFSGYLLVHQTQRAHREILERLEQLKRRMKGNAVEEP